MVTKFRRSEYQQEKGIEENKNRRFDLLRELSVREKKTFGEKKNKNKNQYLDLYKDRVSVSGE